MILALVQPVTPIIVKVTGEPPPEIGVVDIIFGSLGITGLVLVGSALLGVLLGLVFIAIRKRMERNEPDHSPSSAYGFTPYTSAETRDERQPD